HTHSTTTTAFACIFQCFFCQQVQQSCNSSSASPDASEEPCPTDMVKMTKSKTFQAYLPSCHRTYSCIHCRAHLANHDELISKLKVTCLTNDRATVLELRMRRKNPPLAVVESACERGLRASGGAGTPHRSTPPWQTSTVKTAKPPWGWKYEHAFESSQKYKEGKFIIELAHMIKDNGWE
ncbi:unnamed protein product, partial [Tetraodon nigroviridis]